MEKDKLSKETTEFYKREVWRKMKFRSYSYGKKSIDTFLNKIKETFGERNTQMKHFMPTMNKGLRKLIHKKYDTITINECNTSKKCCGCHSNLEYYKDKEGKQVFRLLTGSTCVRPDVKCISVADTVKVPASLEHFKQTVFRTRYVNSAVNIREITRIWINNQTRPEAFKIPPFANSCKKET